jgi:hypothetical protein
MNEIDVTKVTAIEYLEKLIEIVSEEACRDYIDCEDCKYHNISCVSTEEIADIGAENHIRSVMMFNAKLKIDWSKVEEDTLIEVSDDGKGWYRRYFANYKDGKVYAFINGGTSKTVNNENAWNYARIADED